VLAPEPPLVTEARQILAWETAGPSSFPDVVVVGSNDVLHPSVQASAYAAYLRGSHSAFTEDGFELSACAYLHNMAAGDARGLKGLAYDGALRGRQLAVAADAAACNQGSGGQPAIIDPRDSLVAG
jgi:hypothetical protein